MQKFVFFAILIGIFTVMNIYSAEKTIELSDIDLTAEFAETDDGKLLLSWQPLPYPCFYRVDFFSKTTDDNYHPMGGKFTFDSLYQVPSTAIPMYYRVSAFGIFGCLYQSDELIENPNFPTPPRPVAISHYTADNPASLMPFLLWHTVPTAVCYELEILSGVPDKEGGIELSKNNSLYSTRRIFTNGYQADLRPYRNRSQLFWRVRALGLHHEPIGEFSPTMAITIDEKLPMPDSPLINNFDQMPNFVQPLYPVYEWIPIHGADRYEVELAITPPVPNNTIPMPDRIWYKTVENASTSYDEYARPWAGDYYWRVRAVDEHGETVGHYSNTEKFKVSARNTRVKIALFGDSITHGGGAVSYPPCALEYSYGTYLDFPTINLGRSGDTSRTSLNRFNDDVLPIQPLNLLILMGSNSLRADEISAQDIIDDMEAVKKLCEANDIRPIFLTLMPINPQNIAYAFQTDTDPAWRQKLTMVNAYIKQQPYYIDLEPHFYDKEHMFLPYKLSIDGLHPDIRGKMLMGEIINQHKDLFR